MHTQRTLTKCGFILNWVKASPFARVVEGAPVKPDKVREQWMEKDYRWKLRTTVFYITPLKHFITGFNMWSGISQAHFSEHLWTSQQSGAARSVNPGLGLPGNRVKCKLVWGCVWGGGVCCVPGFVAVNFPSFACAWEDFPSKLNVNKWCLRLVEYFTETTRSNIWFDLFCSWKFQFDLFWFDLTRGDLQLLGVYINLQPVSPENPSVCFLNFAATQFNLESERYLIIFLKQKTSPLHFLTSSQTSRILNKKRSHPHKTAQLGGVWNFWHFQTDIYAVLPDA